MTENKSFRERVEEIREQRELESESEGPGGQVVVDLGNATIEQLAAFDGCPVCHEEFDGVIRVGKFGQIESPVCIFGNVVFLHDLPLTDENFPSDTIPFGRRIENAEYQGDELLAEFSANASNSERDA